MTPVASKDVVGGQIGTQHKSIAVTHQGPQLGLEEIDNADLILPRLILTQALSKFVTELNMLPGVFVNSLTKQIVADTTFIPVVANKYFDLLKKDVSSDRMVFDVRVTDKDDSRLEGRRFFSEGNIRADVNTVIAVIALIDGKPIIIPFTKTSYKTGKTLLTMAKFAGGAFFAHKYKLSVKKEIMPKGTYFISEIVQAGESSQEEYNAALDLYKTFSKRSLTNVGLEGDAIEGVDTEIPF